MVFLSQLKSIEALREDARKCRGGWKGSYPGGCYRGKGRAGSRSLDVMSKGRGTKKEQAAKQVAGDKRRARIKELSEKVKAGSGDSGLIRGAGYSLPKYGDDYKPKRMSKGQAARLKSMGSKAKKNGQDPSLLTPSVGKNGLMYLHSKSRNSYIVFDDKGAPLIGSDNKPVMGKGDPIKRLPSVFSGEEMGIDAKTAGTKVESYRAAKASAKKIAGHRAEMKGKERVENGKKFSNFGPASDRFSLQNGEYSVKSGASTFDYKVERGQIYRGSYDVKSKATKWTRMTDRAKSREHNRGAALEDIYSKMSSEARRKRDIKFTPAD